MIGCCVMTAWMEVWSMATSYCIRKRPLRSDQTRSHPIHPIPPNPIHSQPNLTVAGRLPPSLQKGEGYVYDITTHAVKNKELYDRKKAPTPYSSTQNVLSP